MRDNENLTLSGNSIHLGGNQVIRLDDTSSAWILRKGSVAAFAATRGGRRFLFQADPEAVLFGLALPGGCCFEGVTLEDCELLRVPLEQLEKAPGFAQTLEEWVARLACAVDLPAEGYATLDDFYAGLGRAIQLLQDSQETEQRERIVKRLEHDRSGIEALHAQMIALIRPRKAPPCPKTSSPLLDAARAVGLALNIPIHPPAASEDTARLRDPLDAIARASRIRTRKVLLEANWFQQDCGPLVGYLEDGMRPVALLRVSGKRYEMFDPNEGTRLTVDAATNETLYPLATMFYKPFPERALKALDLLGNAMQGRLRELVALFVVGILGALLGMLTPQATGMLIDQVIPDSNRAMLLQLGAALLASSFGIAIFQLCQGLLILRLESLADANTQGATWDRVLSLSAPFFRRYSVGDLCIRLMAISQIRIKLSGTTLSTIFTSLFALLNLILMFSYSVPLATVATQMALLTVVVTGGHTALILKKNARLRLIEGKLFGLVVQLINGVAKLRVTGSESRAVQHWGGQFLEQQRLRYSVQGLEDSIATFNEVFPPLCSLLLFYTAANSAGLQILGQGGLSTGTFLAFNAAFGIFIGGMTALSNSFVDLLDVNDLWKRAKPVLIEPMEVSSERTDPGRLSGRVAIDRLTFRYDEGGRVILDDVTLHADPGEHIALVGPSGCGKSTLFRLLLGFETPESGMVTYDGHDLSEIDVRAVRRQLGIVLQNARLQAGSLFENIACGALITQDEAWEAARCAGFIDDIEAMPMGMHTVISEGGSNLSGGQRQRLIIARAFALQPRIIMFDEATSALDNRTQAIVSESLDRLKITRITIAHRLSTIRNADRIYAIEAGKVVQVGTFDELMKQQEGLFAKLAKRQMD